MPKLRVEGALSFLFIKPPCVDSLAYQYIYQKKKKTLLKVNLTPLAVYKAIAVVLLVFYYV